MNPGDRVATIGVIIALCVTVLLVAGLIGFYALQTWVNRRRFGPPRRKPQGDA
jgi:hypothetical protein